MGSLPASNPESAHIVRISLSKAAFIAVALEILMVLIFVIIASRQIDKAPPKPPIAILSFPILPDIPKKPPPLPKKTPPSPQKKPDTPRPIHHQLVQSMLRPAPTVADIPKAAIAETTTARPVDPSPSAPPAPAPPSPPSISVTFRDKVRSAVQAAVAYPFAAREAHISGRTKVSFSYTDGVSSNAKIITSSGYGMLDKAALAAVNSASYPQPAAEFIGKMLTFQIWVQFSLTGEE